MGRGWYCTIWDEPLVLELSHELNRVWNFQCICGMGHSKPQAGSCRPDGGVLEVLTLFIFTNAYRHVRIHVGYDCRSLWENFYNYDALLIIIQAHPRSIPYNWLFMWAWYLRDYASKTKFHIFYIYGRIATPHVEPRIPLKLSFLAKMHKFLGHINNRLYGINFRSKPYFWFTYNNEPLL